MIRRRLLDRSVALLARTGSEGRRLPEAIAARALAVAIVAGTLLVAFDAAAEKPSTRACIDAATEGQKLRDRGKLLDARSKFLTCSQRTCPADIRSDCGTWLSRVEESIPRIVLGARDERGQDLVHVRVRANDVVVATELVGREQAFDPGPYRFDFETEDGRQTTTAAVLRAGDATRSIVATFPAKGAESARPAPRSPFTGIPAPGGAEQRAGSGRTIALVALGGGALVSVAAFAGFALHASSEYGDLERTCAPTCTDADTRALRTDLVLANVSGIAALGLLAIFGGVALFTGPESTTQARIAR